MAGTPSRRRAAAAILTLTFLVLAGCGSGGANPSGTTPPGGEGQLGNAPSATQSPGGPDGGTPTGGSTNTGNPNPTTTEAKYPDSARAYAEALLRAWAKPDYIRLAELGNTAAVQQIRDSITYGGNPNSTWSYIKCGAAEAAGSTDCIFRNAHGDETKITLLTSQIGYHNAITAASLDRTQYPGDPLSYVNGLWNAYANGNVHRVLRLSNDTVKNKLTCTFGYTASSEPLDGTHTKVIYNEQGGSLVKRMEFKVLTQPGGKAGAVKDILLAKCS